MARISGVDLPREKRVEVGLTYIFGIGLKTAQRIILELKDKMSREAAETGFGESFSGEVPTDASNAGEAISALVVLGYSQSEAASAVMKQDPALPVEELIKAGLRALSSR